MRASGPPRASRTAAESDIRDARRASATCCCDARVASADLVFTGEGRLDEQSLQGKGPVGVARLARRLGKKVVGIAGSVDDSAALRAQFDLLIAIKPAAMPLDEAMRRTGELIESAVFAHVAPLRALSS